MLAHYKCLNCGCEWESRTGPTQCPKCGFAYMKWLNYEKMWDHCDNNKNKE